jgi:hypothetical protein
MALNWPTKRKQLLLPACFPELAVELEGLLRTKGENKLADQVHELEIRERCRCGDDFCATIYVRDKPAKTWGPNHRNIDLEPRAGMIILDIVEERIACIEVLYRDEVRKTLLALLP